MKEKVLNLNLNMDYVLNLKEAAKGLSQRNLGLVYTPDDFLIHFRHGTLASRPVVAQKEITLGDFHYVLDDRSDYYVISSVEFLEKPKVKDEKGLVEYEYLRDGNGKLFIRGILYKDRFLYSYLFGESIDIERYNKGRDPYPPYSDPPIHPAFWEIIWQLEFAKKNMALYSSIINRNIFEVWMRKLMSIPVGIYDVEGEYWSRDEKLIVDEDIEDFNSFIIWHATPDRSHGGTIINYDLCEERSLFANSGGTLKFEKIADAIPYIEGNDLIPMDKRNAIVEKLKQYSAHL